MAWLTTDSFHSVDRMLEHPGIEAAGLLKLLTPNARALLRYQVSEQNRAAFAAWETVQLAFGLFLFFYFLFGTRLGKLSMGLVLVMIALTAAQKLFLTPELIGLGRRIDFASADAMQAERSTFWLLHSGYAGVELLKWAVGLGLMGKLVLSRRARSDYARENLDPVDKRDNRHINR